MTMLERQTYELVSGSIDYVNDLIGEGLSVSGIAKKLSTVSGYSISPKMLLRAYGGVTGGNLLKEIRSSVTIREIHKQVEGIRDSKVESNNKERNQNTYSSDDVSMSYMLRKRHRLSINFRRKG
jgi:hypothetical protein